MRGQRYLDVIGRLEVDVFRKSIVHGPRRAVIRVGEPVDLRDSWDAYRADRRETVAAVTTELRTRAKTLLDGLSRLAPVIEPPPALAPATSGAV